ncbi:MAG: carboxylesterase family protein [Gammaproteobacteria bacterium]|jgi:para-nitrobenzyl esterase|nr:carboxylesterase family protein [Gammaproteobacteria bacterium]
MMCKVPCGGYVRVAAALVVGWLLSPPVAAADAPRVVTDQGALRGFTTAVSDAFFAIPYAAPPVGELRWRAPQAAPAWSGVLDATARAPMCMQPVFPGADAAADVLPTSEDCLYLNVWRPAGTAADAGLPVMVWIHGGSHIFGAGSLPRFDGDHLTARGVVLVTFNYRLGVFGSFTHPAIEAEQAGQPRGNYALLDQLAALSWVRDNIAAFGGDPGNVTIFGNSSGGASVNALSITPAARGLFQRAIAQSGGIRVDDTLHLTEPGATPFAKPLIDNGRRLAADLQADTLPELRALDAQDIMAWQLKANPSVGPAIDGLLLTEVFAKPFYAGELGEVDFMFGVDSWEASILESVPIPPPVYLRFFQGVEEARAAYGNPDDATMMRVMFEDKTFFGGARFLAKYAAKAGKRAYLYHFSYRPTAARNDGQPGAAHSDEVQYLFDYLPGSVVTRRPLAAAEITAEDRALGDLLADYWTNFAKAGNPNGAGLPAWPAYTEANDTWMDLGVKPAPLPGFRADDMDYWESVYLKSLD